MNHYLRIFRRQGSVRVLGPYTRAVIWVQGCLFACNNCIVPESWDLKAGELVSVEDLAKWILLQTEIEGITISGGEPMLQAEALSELIGHIRCHKDLGVVCYTGYTLEQLQKGTICQQNLLQKIDLLIDGVYQEKSHQDLRWRGSTNQRLLPLTNRYQNDVASLTKETDKSTGLEFFIEETGSLGFAGVPNRPNFRQEFEKKLLQKGVIVKPEK